MKVTIKNEGDFKVRITTITGAETFIDAGESTGITEAGDIQLREFTPTTAADAAIAGLAEADAHSAE